VAHEMPQPSGTLHWPHCLHWPHWRFFPKKLAGPPFKSNGTAHPNALSVSSAQPRPSLVPPGVAPCNSRSQTVEAEGHSRATQPALRPLSWLRCNSTNYLERVPINYGADAQQRPRTGLFPLIST
jgi:hypothetical protein